MRPVAIVLGSVVEAQPSGHDVLRDVAEGTLAAVRRGAQPHQCVGHRGAQLDAEHPRGLVHHGPLQPFGRPQPVVVRGVPVAPDPLPGRSAVAEQRRDQGGGQRVRVPELSVAESAVPAAQQGQQAQPCAAQSQREAAHAVHPELPRGGQQHGPAIGPHPLKIRFEDRDPGARGIGPGPLAEGELQLLEPQAQFGKTPQRLGRPRAVRPGRGLSEHGHGDALDPQGPGAGRRGIPAAPRAQTPQNLGHAVAGHRSPLCRALCPPAPYRAS